MMIKRQLTRKLTDEERKNLTKGLSDFEIETENMTPAQTRKFFEKIFPKVDETWWMFREQIIASIEGYTGTLESIRWRDVSSNDMQKILLLIREIREASRKDLTYFEDLIEKAIWCQTYEDENENPKERQYK